MDVSSVKVEGVGCDIATRLLVEPLPNRETSGDRPRKSTDTDDSSESPDTDIAEQDNNDSRHKLKSVKTKILDLTLIKRKASDAVSSAEFRLEVLDTYMRGIAGNPEHSTTFLQDGLKIYQEEREAALRDLLEWQLQVEKLDKEILALQKPKDRLRKRVMKERAKVRHERAKKNERIRKEQTLRCPEQVYAVIVSIDVEDTPEGDEGLDHSNAYTNSCDLTLSYATSHASWSPIYDMALSTTTGSGTLYFDAVFTNHTSETWDDCSIVLSTWKPTFSSPGVPVSALQPWFVSRLPRESASAGNGPNELIPDHDGPFLTQAAEGYVFCHAPPPQGFPIFEDDDANQECARHFTPDPENIPPESDGSVSGLSSPSPTGNRGPIYGRSSRVRQQTPFRGGHDSTIREPLRTIREHAPFLDEDDYSVDESVDETAMIQVPLTTIREPTEPESKESEFMATYTLAGRRSLSPSLTSSRCRVARIPLSDVDFSRVAVPKHTKAVFLNAQLLNPSTISLPPGRAELTLDGRYVGNIDLPSWGPSDTCALSLGIDPWIRVIYRRQVGKEKKYSVTSSTEEGSSNVFSRTIILVNIRDEIEGGPMDVTVLDQVPLSTDPQVQIALVTPYCLRINGPSIGTGESGTWGRELWGRAEVKLNRDGEVEWAVTVNPRCAAKLSLAYSCSIHT